MEKLEPLTSGQIQDRIKMFHEALKPYAKDSAFFMSVMLGQVGIESYWGSSTLAKEANNYTGHKFKAPFSNVRPDDYFLKDAGEEEGGKKVIYEDEKWRKYQDIDDWAKHHADWLTQSEWYKDYYKDAINAKTPEEQLEALTGTYATDSSYATSVLRVINDYNLKQYDEEAQGEVEGEKGEVKDMAYPKPKMVDRRARALGAPGHGAYARRNKSAIKQIVRHYTAVNRRGSEANTIKAHENYWRSHHGWDMGGYGIYIDYDGVIYHNYDFEIVTYGAGKLNPSLFHVCLEGSSLANHSAAQLKALDDVMLWLITGPLSHLGGNDIRGHWEIPYNSTACPGMTKGQLDAYRSKIAKLADSDWGNDTNPSSGIEFAKNGKYTVKHGDTLWAIGQAHGVSVERLQEWNKIAKGQWLKTGQVIYVVEPKLNAYTVVKGDYLWKIATEHGVTVEELKKWNELKNNFVYVGQELFISDPDLSDIETPVEAPSAEDQQEENEVEEEKEEVVVEPIEDQPDDEGDRTPAIVLEENQYLRWDGVVIQTSVVPQ